MLKYLLAASLVLSSVSLPAHAAGINAKCSAFDKVEQNWEVFKSNCIATRRGNSLTLHWYDGIITRLQIYPSKNLALLLDSGIVVPYRELQYRGKTYVFINGGQYDIQVETDDF